MTKLLFNRILALLENLTHIGTYATQSYEMEFYKRPILKLDRL